MNYCIGVTLQISNLWLLYSNKHTVRKMLVQCSLSIWPMSFRWWNSWNTSVMRVGTLFRFEMHYTDSAKHYSESHFACVRSEMWSSGEGGWVNFCDERPTAGRTFSMPQRARLSLFEKHAILQECRNRSIRGGIEKIKKCKTGQWRLFDWKNTHRTRQLCASCGMKKHCTVEQFWREREEEGMVCHEQCFRRRIAIVDNTDVEPWRISQWQSNTREG